MALRHVRAFGHDFDLVAGRAGEKLQVQVLENGKAVQSSVIADGGTATVGL